MTTVYGLPGTKFNSAGASFGANANTIYYAPFYPTVDAVISALAMNILSGVAGNIYFAIYAANTDGNPTGAPLYDSGSIAVATSFTGYKTKTGLSIAVTGGSKYVTAFNCSGTGQSSLLTAMAPSPWISSLNNGVTLTQMKVKSSATAGTFATNPTTPDAHSTGTDFGIRHAVFSKYVE